MTKKQLISNLRDREGMTWNQATRVVNELFEDIANNVINGEPVYIPKFGRFCRSAVRQKRCKHPETGKFIMLPPHDVIRFRMAEDLRRKLDGEA